MTVATQRARIAAICGTQITGITTATAGGPRSLSDADLPAIIVLTKEAQKLEQDGLLYVDRTYHLALLVMPWAEGIELEAEEKCDPFYERIEDAFFARQSLQLADNTTRLDGVQMVTVGPDSGVISIGLAGTDYAGVTFEIVVQSIRQITRGT